MHLILEFHPKIVYTKKIKEVEYAKCKNSQCFTGGGGWALSKLEQRFYPISHCGVPLILRVLNPKNLKNLLCSYKNEAKVSNLDCFAIARNDAKRYAADKVVILRALARRISCKKRSFTFVQDDSKSHSEAECRRISCEKRSFGFHPQDDIGVLSTRHCETRSVEAIQERDTSGSALSMTNKRQKAAFTLAEVLITLGIIGIVAAMTLPTLLSNVQDKILESESKKAANIVANGYKLMMARDEIFNIKDMPMWQCQDLTCVSGIHREIFNISNDNQAVLENLKNVKYYNSKNQAVPFSWERDPYYAFITTDGFAYGVLQPDNWDEVNSFDIIADVNANNNPNRVAKDLHKYRFSGEGGQLFDVTDELEQVSECSIDNPEGCTTREECFSLPTGVGVCAQWKNNKCSIIYNCAV